MARIGRITAGFALVGAGVLMLALPGPGLLAIAVGLALLAPDFRWARRLMERIKKNPPATPGESSCGNDAKSQAGG